MPKLLKFRYFLMFALLCGCGESPKSKEAGKHPENGAVVEEPVASQDKQNILFFGNSLTAAYGLDTAEGFPNLIQQKLDSLGLPYNAINSGLSGETTSGGRNRLEWVLNQEVAIFVLELGANDGLRGIPLSETRANLRAMIDLVRKKYPRVKVVLAGMQIPPNMGPEYTTEFRGMFPEIANEKETALIPFLLEGVAGNPELNLEDGIHPNAAGQKIVAENVWEVLSPLLLQEKQG
ncbi:arylesterase [Maribacter sp. 2307ULW6-5]|uniref:arylesterase n=1 Tax=Maribacter sp. 2307ULW6-5 TaxID=3386275 RepID=UPI0039BD928B